MNPAFLILPTLAPAAVPAAPTPASAPESAAFVAASPLASYVSQDAPEVKKDVWTGSIAIGATYQSGNTDTRAANANALFERRGENDRWTAKGFWDYAENKVDGDYVLTSRKAGADVKYDYFLSEKLYVNGVAGVESDTFKDLSLRTWVGAGVGYQWVEDETLKWGSEAGLTYFWDDYKVAEDDDYPAGRLANNIEWNINDKTSLANYLEVYPNLDDTEDVRSRSDTRLKTSLTEAMFAQLQWVWDYDNVPTSGSDRNDHKVVLGIGWSF